jgi:hypothetical protein
MGIALEVEAGRATMGNAIYRDLIQASLMVMPAIWRSRSRRSTATNRVPVPLVSELCQDLLRLEAIYGSPRLTLPFDGLLLIGY